MTTLAIKPTASLVTLAEACNDGASNPIALTLKLAECLKENRQNAQTAAFKIVIGHLSFILRESQGPSDNAFGEYLNEIA